MKEKIISKIILQLEKELSSLVNSAMSVKDAATNEEAKAENKYDTRGLEASYLAGAQAKRAKELQEIVDHFRQMKCKIFNETTPIEATALVEVQIDDSKIQTFFLVPQRGGMKFIINEKEVLVISVSSPIGTKMFSKLQGDAFEHSIKGTKKEYFILKTR